MLMLGRSEEQQGGQCGWIIVRWAEGNRSDVKKISRLSDHVDLMYKLTDFELHSEFGVSRKHHYNNMADLEIPQQYPEENLEICQGCFALAHDDCQETRCYCLKNIL